MFSALGGLVLSDTPGGRDELRELVAPALRDLVDGLSPAAPAPALSFAWHGTHVGGMPVDALTTSVRIHDASGRLAGTALISKPGASMAILATVAIGGDLRHVQRVQRVAKAGRRPAAILFADLEASSPLAAELLRAGAPPRPCGR